MWNKPKASPPPLVPEAVPRPPMTHIDVVSNWLETANAPSSPPAIRQPVQSDVTEIRLFGLAAIEHDARSKLTKTMAGDKVLVEQMERALAAAASLDSANQEQHHPWQQRRQQELVFNPDGLETTPRHLWRAAIAVRNMVQNIKEPNELWPLGATVRVLSNDAEPDIVAAMVAEFARQMSKTTTASALMWTNSFLAKEGAAGRVAAGRAIEKNFNGQNKVVDYTNYRQDTYVYARRNEAQRWDYKPSIIAAAAGFQNPEDFIQESCTKRGAFEFFVVQCKALAQSPELDEAENYANEHERTYAELTRLYSNCPHLKMGGMAVNALRRGRSLSAALATRARLEANPQLTSPGRDVVILEKSLPLILEERAHPGNIPNQNTHWTTISSVKIVCFRNMYRYSNMWQKST